MLNDFQKSAAKGLTLNKKGIWLFFILLALIQIYLADCLLELPHYFDQTCLGDIDYPYHYYHCLMVSELLRTVGESWAYSPFHNLGYPIGTYNDSDTKAWERFVWLLFFLPPSVSFKLFMLLIILINPYFIYFAAKNFGLDRLEAALAAFLAAAYSYFSVQYYFYFWGLIGFTAATYFFILFISILHRFLQTKRMKYWLGLVLIGSLGISMHPVFFLAQAAIPCLILMIYWFLGQGRWSSLKWLMLAFILIFLPNLDWFLTLLKFNDPNTQFTYPFFRNTDPLEIFKVYTLQETPFGRGTAEKYPVKEPLLLIFGLIGAFTLHKRGKTLSGLVLSISALAQLLVAYYGGLHPFFGELQILRIIIGGDLLLGIAAGVSVKSLADYLVYRGNWLLRIGSLVAIVTALYYSKEIPKEIIKRQVRQLTPNLEDRVKPFTDLFQKYTDLSGRIWIEGSGHLSRMRYAGGHIHWIFPYFAKRLYVITPFSYVKTKYAGARLIDGQLNEQDLSLIPPYKMRQFIEEYNILWIFCWSTNCKGYLGLYPDFALPQTTFKSNFRMLQYEDSEFVLYRLNRQPSFFLKGSGRLVSADYNRLEFADIKPSVEKDAVVSFNYIDTLKTEPAGVILKPYEKHLNPNPVIEIVDPPEKLVIYNGY